MAIRVFDRDEKAIVWDNLVDNGACVTVLNYFNYALNKERGYMVVEIVMWSLPFGSDDPLKCIDSSNTLD